MVYYGNPWLSRFANSNLTASREQLLLETQLAPSQGFRVAASISFHFCSICRCQKLASYLTYKGILGILLLISMHINDDFKALLQSYFPHAIDPCSSWLSMEVPLSNSTDTLLSSKYMSEPQFKVWSGFLIVIQKENKNKNQEKVEMNWKNPIQKSPEPPLPPRAPSLVSCFL